ncbi:MAG TPA: hypothetical protein IAC22_10160 [Candidatus Caccocola faecipullorum]|nr:hypothetical protein [Candidatus Caccocola faecipullorum]
MSLAQITEKIRNDAQKEADEILSKAKAQAEAITSKAEKECAGIQEGFDERFGAERPEIIKRREIVADIDVSKMMLSAKRELIEDVYRGALEKMKALPKDKYLAFCADLLDGGVTTKDELVVVGDGEKYIDAAWLDSYNASHGTKLALAGEKADIAGGFILRRGRISVNCSWEMLLKVSQEKQESDVVKRLFPSA